MTKIGLIQFLLLFLISAAFGQKVKYKDIYALLNAKQFEQAEPFLKQYLRETADNPNAYLFMGNIFQEKASKNDVLKQTAIAVANMDSAIFYYDKTRKTLDDREVRKNKEYYEAYNRRDLRTGEFGVKLSDIQFDIEKKIESLKERIDKVKMIRHFFSVADTTYKRSTALYLALQQKYPSLNQLYLRADQSTIKELETLAARFDSCAKAFEQYKIASSLLGKTGYNQTLTLKAITDFKKDGGGTSDFYRDDVVMWDYKKFAEEARQVIEKEILPLRSHLITYDVEINKLREKLQTDSVSVRSDLTKLIDKLVYDQLRKFDPSPLPTIVFAMKTTDLEYRSMQLEHRPLRDSADIHLQIRMIRDELKLLANLDSTINILSDDDFARQSTDYADFIARTYENASVLNSYIRSLRDFSVREQNEKTSLLEGYSESLQYIVDGADSIPLGTEVAGQFIPLVINDEKFTLGVSLKDTTQLQGYFYTITPSRKPEVKAYFPLDTKAFTMKNVPVTQALAYADAGGQIYYLMIYGNQPIKDRYPATLAKVYRS
ncbi:MAG TPA: hypothetical protein VFT90_14855, partial [Chryseosolibacter sp.]|nr:hypothetical protein [Chryseosolibacter sp.]